MPLERWCENAFCLLILQSNKDGFPGPCFDRMRRHLFARGIGVRILWLWFSYPVEQMPGNLHCGST